jgi:hypothetical protein
MSQRSPGGIAIAERYKLIEPAATLDTVGRDGRARLVIKHVSSRVLKRVHAGLRPRISRLRGPIVLGSIGACAAIVVACTVSIAGLGPTSSPGSTSPPASHPPQSMGPTASPNTPPSLPAIVSCSLEDFADLNGLNATAGPAPQAIPAGLPATLVPDGAAVYVASFGADAGYPATYLYSVAPSGLVCIGTRGNYLAVRVEDGQQQEVVDYDFPGSVGPNQTISCQYIDAARAAAQAFEGVDQPEDCRGNPDEIVVPLSTGEIDSYVALVFGRIDPYVPQTNSPVKTIAAFTFAKDPTGVGGGSTRADCTLPTTQRETCVASLAFFLAQTGIASDVGLDSLLRDLADAIRRFPEP